MSLAFAVKVIEIMAVAKIVAGDGYRYLEMYLDASVLYWVICFVLERLFASLEKKIGKYEHKTMLKATL
jgi:L-cystine transport system permease protein